MITSFAYIVLMTVEMEITFQEFANMVWLNLLEQHASNIIERKFIDMKWWQRG